MISSRLGLICGAAALALASVNSTVAFAAAAPICETPVFGIPGEILIEPSDAELQDLIAGTFFAKNGGAPNCDCDLAVAVSPKNGQHFVRLLGSTNDGAFPQGGGFETTLLINNPQAIARGRFNEGSRTGLDDLVVANPDGISIFVAADDYKGRQPPHKAGESPFGVATGDFDGDGHVDVAVISDDRRLTILFGDGTGKLKPVPMVRELGGQPKSLSVGKFRGRDRIDDVAVASTNSGLDITIEVVGTNASGALQEVATSIGDKGSEVWIATADLAAAGKSRDLVVAFWNEGPQPGGMVRLLLGNSNGSFAQAQTIPIEARPRAVKVNDMDGDGVPDLIVSASGDKQPQPQDGIRIFKGIRSPPHFDQTSNRLPDNRPAHHLTAGRFGGKAGLAAAYPPTTQSGLNSISIYLESGNFVSAATTAVPVDARLFVVGAFQSRSGNDSVVDLAYVHLDNTTGKHQFTVRPNDGAGKFPAELNTLLGRDPILVATGKFDRRQGRETLDVAVVDSNLGDDLRRPFLKILFGQGDGQFRVGDPEFLLDAGDIPVQMITGPFKREDQDTAFDIAIVSATATGGKLTLFINNGAGEFSKFVETLPFRPAAMAGSNGFRPKLVIQRDGRDAMIGGVYDFVIKEFAINKFMFLKSADGGPASGFIRRELFEGAGGVDWLRTGHITNDIFNDIVTVDNDMTVRVFANKDGEISPTPRIDVGHSQLFIPKFFLEEFGGNELGLAAVVIGKNLNPVILTIGQMEGKWGKRLFLPMTLPTNPSNMVVVSENQQTIWLQPDTKRQESVVDSPEINSAVVGHFVGRRNNKPDLAFLVKPTVQTVLPDACPQGPRPPKPPDPFTRVTVRCVCPDGTEGGPGLRCRAPPDNSFPGECGVPGQRCPPEPPPAPTCTSTSTTVPNPTKAFCESRKTYSFLITFRNACGG